MDALRALGGETWFALGDHDLHCTSSVLVAQSRQSLSVSLRHCAAFGITARILAMSDSPVRTRRDRRRYIAFQHYFVCRRCEPVVRAIRFAGAPDATPTPGLVDLIAGGAFAAAVICPSNPYLSVDPILAVSGIAAALARARTPIIAVSPIIGGRAVKGPTAKIMAELGIAITNQSIAAHYRRLIDGLVIDEADLADRDRIDVPALVTRTMMRDLADRERLAGDVIAFAETITHRPAKRAGGRR
jgi:LPPG:FO 2-phospho-L-lactate transferase